VIYVQSDLVRVNPTVYLFMYRILKVKYNEGKQQYLVTRIAPDDGQNVSVVDVAGVMLDTGGSREDG
jgi:hypothetical protein